MSDLRTMQPSFNGGILSPSLQARVDLAKYASGVAQAKNMIVHAHGGISNRAGLRFVAEVKYSYRDEGVKLIPFQFNTEQSYLLEVGYKYIRFYKDGAAILKNGAIYEITTPYEVRVGEIGYAQEADVMYLVHGQYPVHKLSRLAEDNWTLTQVTFAPKTQVPTGVAAAAGVGGGAIPYKYKVSAVDSATAEESLPSVEVMVFNNLAVDGYKNKVTWAAVAGASRYIVYKEDNGVYGYIGGTSGLEFTDENITANTSNAPQTGENPFVGAGNYPRVVNFIEQRLALASTLNEPQAIYMSQSANYENFGRSQPAKASDAVTFRIKAREVNEIRALVAMKGMLVLTSGAQWMVTGGSKEDAISPTSIKIDNQGYRGAAKIQPLMVGNMAIFAQARGGVARDFSYQFSEDSYVDRDLTIMAKHLFEGRDFKAWGYAQSPHSIVWAVMDDGRLMSMTYMKEHDVWGWCEHESRMGDVPGIFGRGAFKDVCVVGEDREDVVYFVVQRFVNYEWKQYIERMETRHFMKVEDCFFVDCGLSRKGATAIKDVYGLNHLEGLTLVGLVDGNVVRGLPVIAGKVTLPDAGKVIHLGLGMVAMMETLPLDLGQVQGLGTVAGRMKSVSKVTLRVEKTRGIWTGVKDGARDGRELVEYKQRAVEAWNEAIKLYTGDVGIIPAWDWNTHGSIIIKQFDPLPMTILGVMPDVTLGK